MENFTDVEVLGKFNLTDQEFLMSKNFRNTVEFQEDNLTTIPGRTIYDKYIRQYKNERNHQLFNKNAVCRYY